jgi:hypothetical protein
MLTRSFRLSKKSPAGTWLAELTFPWGQTRAIDTKQEDRAPAERRAKWILRHTIARRRHAERTALKKKGKPIPPELELQRPGRRKPATPAPAAPAPKRKPGRPRKDRAAAAAPARPTIDHQAIADRLRSLTAQAAPAAPPEEQTPAAAAAPGPDQGELGEDDPTPTQRPPIAAEDAPPMPDAPPETLIPEVMPPAPTSEDAELFSALIATFAVAGFIKANREMGAAATPPLETAEPHAGSVAWMQTGIENKVRKIFGDRQIGDGTKIFLGAIGISLSMFLGAQVKTAAPPAAAADANTESERERSGAAAAGPSALAHHQNGAPQAPNSAATGKFR